LVYVPAAWAAAPAVVLSPGVRGHLPLQVTTLVAVRRATQVDAFAKVLDPGPLAQLESDLLAEEASAEASAAEARRARALNASGAGVASKDAEAAAAQAANDASHVQLLRRRLGLEWGPGVARLSDGARKALIDRLSSGKSALVHVDTPNDEGQDGARSVEIDVGSGSAHGVVLGAARQAEPRLQSSGLIVEVSGPSAILLSIGLTQSAHINQSSAVQGVVLPRSAVIRFEGSDWAYVRLDADRFERRLAASPTPVADGLFTDQGFQPGDQVVSQGAAELFAIERGQATQSAASRSP
jgi:hypothetical protein